ncbi:hypothetical protein FQA39_LY16302 [Lamprigera yunnana]|nr:hypothetical protein FQA39_LY16302 [Lamprigera yunnana]
MDLQLILNNDTQKMSTQTKYIVYTVMEKILLATLVKDNAIIENKRTDSATLMEKHKAWEEIYRTYNSQPEVDTMRTPEQLKKLWNNLKQRKRKKTTALRYEILATGGAPSKKPTLDPVLQVVEDAAPSLDVSITCPWDSTALFEIERSEARSKPTEGIVGVETPTTRSKPKNRRSIAIASVSKEKDAGVQKLHRATEQQQLLFNLRKQILEEELQRAVEERAAA